MVDKGKGIDYNDGIIAFCFFFSLLGGTRSRVTRAAANKRAAAATAPSPTRQPHRNLFLEFLSRPTSLFVWCTTKSFMLWSDVCFFS